jgi:plastocyanin
MLSTYPARIAIIAMLCLSLLADGRLCHCAEVAARLVSSQSGHAANKAMKDPPAVVWLDPVPTNPGIEMSPGKFVLVQKNKMFAPHLLVVPVGSTVAFPNADPFFHNVFSLFDGKRFDLGLYEAGSSRSVVFSRKGVSYIFCDIHSEMSAVVIALTTPYYSVSDMDGKFRLEEVPDGDYDLHIWIEGQRQGFLEGQTRRVHITGHSVNLGEIRSESSGPGQHLDKFGRPYEPEPRPDY